MGELRVVIVGALVAALAGTAAFPAQAAKSPPKRYVDCSRAKSGNGSLKRPWNSLSRANRAVLGPGARLYLRRGTVCRGTLVPRASGTAKRRVLVGAYGSRKRASRALIDPAGALEGVLLEDVAHVVVEGLDVTNRGPRGRRRGVHVVARKRVVRDVVVRGLHIHDVDGDLSKGANGSGGIQVSAVGPPPIRFDKLLIAKNLIENVGRSGISIGGSGDPTRPSADQPWPEASTGVVVRGNRIDRIDGDGIVPRGTVGAVIEDNVVSGGNRRGHNVFDFANAVCNAGIWAFHANGTIIQRNEVFGMQFNGCDGTGFDIDYDQDGTVVQFNYSHGNGGGFILLCGDEARPRRAEVRYNLSVGDAATLNVAPCRIAEGRLGTLDTIRIYNNTVVAPAPKLVAEDIQLPLLPFAGAMEFRNNLVVATQPQFATVPCGERCSNNLFYRMLPAGTNVIGADPRFADPGYAGGAKRGRMAAGPMFRLGEGSPARGTGVVVPGASQTDYFGELVPDNRRPSIGFSQGL